MVVGEEEMEIRLYNAASGRVDHSTRYGRHLAVTSSSVHDTRYSLVPIQSISLQINRGIIYFRIL